MQKENKEIKLQQSIIPEFSSGSSTHAVTQETTKRQALKTLKLINDETTYKDLTGRGPAVKATVQGLSYRNITAFTLIEILVVVLVIGILGAIALPQYQKVVWKSEFVKYQTWCRAIYEHERTYYLEHGQYTDDLRNLDITLPGGTKVTSNRTWVNHVFPDGTKIHMNRNDFNPQFYYQNITFDMKLSTGNINCYHRNNERNYKICHAIGCPSKGRNVCKVGKVQ